MFERNAREGKSRMRRGQAMLAITSGSLVTLDVGSFSHVAYFLTYRMSIDICRVSGLAK